MAQKPEDLTVDELRHKAAEEDVEGRSTMKKDELVEALQKTGVEDFSIEQIDGAKALLKLGAEERLVDQADLHRLQKAVAKGVQVTY